MVAATAAPEIDVAGLFWACWEEVRLRLDGQMHGEEQQRSQCLRRHMREAFFCRLTCSLVSPKINLPTPAAPNQQTNYQEERKKRKKKGQSGVILFHKAENPVGARRPSRLGGEGRRIELLSCLSLAGRH